MFVRPRDISDEMVATAWRKGWGVAPESVAYAAVGFGSHHWHGTAGGRRWFLTVDKVDDGGRRLGAALGTAAALRADGRLWVVAPVAGVEDRLLQPIDDRYVLAAYPWVEGEAGSFGDFASADERLAVTARLVDLHAADAGQLPARVDDLTVPARSELVAALNDLDRAWTSGPFAEHTRALLADHRGSLLEALGQYDEVAAAVGAHPERYVVTHGEPHRGNVIFTPDGPALIDWDTALLAPPERDLWRLVDEDDQVRGEYERLSGRTVNDSAVQLYRLWWDLCEVSLFTADFRAPHSETQDTAIAWQGLQASVANLQPAPQKG